MQGAKDASRSFHSGQVKSNIVKKKKFKPDCYKRSLVAARSFGLGANLSSHSPAKEGFRRLNVGEWAAAFVPQTNLI